MISGVRQSFCGVRCKLRRQLPTPSPPRRASRSRRRRSRGWSGHFASIRTARRRCSPVDQPIPSSHDGLLWLHFNLADARALQWLTPANLHDSGAGAALLLSKDTYQQLHTIDDCVYGVISDLLRDVARGDRGHRISPVRHDRAGPGQRPASCAVRGRRHPPRARRRPSHRKHGGAAGDHRRACRRHHGPHRRSRGAGARRGRGAGAVGQRHGSAPEPRPPAANLRPPASAACRACASCSTGSSRSISTI